MGSSIGNLAHVRVHPSQGGPPPIVRLHLAQVLKGRKQMEVHPVTFGVEDGPGQNVYKEGPHYVVYHSFCTIICLQDVVLLELRRKNFVGPFVEFNGLRP